MPPKRARHMASTSLISRFPAIEPSLQPSEVYFGGSGVRNADERPSPTHEAVSPTADLPPPSRSSSSMAAEWYDRYDSGRTGFAEACYLLCHPSAVCWRGSASPLSRWKQSVPESPLLECLANPSDTREVCYICHATRKFIRTPFSVHGCSSRLFTALRIFTCRTRWEQSTMAEIFVWLTLQHLTSRAGMALKTRIIMLSGVKRSNANENSSQEEGGPRKTEELRRDSAAPENRGPVPS
jgi:hypothetical protein